jgi:hypothetical protein
MSSERPPLPTPDVPFPKGIDKKCAPNAEAELVNKNPFKAGTWAHTDYEEGFADAAAGREYRWLDPAYGFGYADAHVGTLSRQRRAQEEANQGVNRNPYEQSSWGFKNYEEGFADAQRDLDPQTDEFAYINGWTDGYRHKAFPNGRKLD